jgi:hypothetical protein
VKVCSVCKTAKPVDEFHKSKSAKDGLRYPCKICCNTANKIYRRTDRGRAQRVVQALRWQSKNPIAHGFGQYRRNAVLRHHEFKLTREEFESFMGVPCHYCGAVSEQVGLDRVVNSLGYSSDNVVSCCSACNYAKRKGTQEDFIELCRAVAERHPRPSKLKLVSGL